MPIRNPFAKRADIYGGGLTQGEENVRPLDQNGMRPTFEKVDTMGSMSSALSIKSGHSQDPPEYKLSVVNDSGVYLPVRFRNWISGHLLNFLALTAGKEWHLAPTVERLKGFYKHTQ